MPVDNLLAGRAQERELLHEYLDRAVAGDQQLVLLEGEAGIGKTALLAAFAMQYSRRKTARIFRLSAPDTEAYRPVHHAALAATDQRLYKRVGGKRQATEVAQSLYLEWIGAIPGVGELLAAITATFDRIRRRRSAAFLPGATSVDEDIEALLTAARRKPLVLLLDDLEQADAAEVARLEKLICDADEGARILIVGAYRTAAPGEPHPPVKRLLRTLPNADEFFVQRRLGPLTPDEVSELVSKRFPGTEAPASFLDRLYQSTGGHPGAVDDALADLQFRGGILRRLGRWQFDPEIAMPILKGGQGPTVDLSALPAATAEIVQAASMLGSEFDGSSLASLLEADELEVEDKLAAAVHYGMLETSGESVLPNGDITSRFRFVSPHLVPLIREAIPAERRILLERRTDAAGTG